MPPGSPAPGTSAQTGIFISAPGKIILFGEHAVVYGRTAVAGSIDLRTYVSLYTSQDGVIYLSLPDLGVEKTWMLKDLHKAAERLHAGGLDFDSDASAKAPDGTPPQLEVLVPLARKLSGSCEDSCGVQHLAVLAFWYLLLGVAQRKRDLSAVKVTVKFRLPSCVGLGSSGAYCVCIAAALLQTSGLIPPPAVPVSGSAESGGLTWDDAHLDMIRKWAATAESLIHGRASGIDAAVCTYGGVASFKPGTRIQHFKNLPDLKVILVNSKVERNTSRMVATVKDRLKKYPEIVEPIFNSIDGISREAITLLNRPEGLNSIPEVNSEHSSGSSQTCNEDEHHSLQDVSMTATGAAATRLATGVGNDRARRASGRSQAPELDGYTALNDLCRINNQLLIALGVGHPKIDQICTLLARYGIHPKMTGAGGGGSVFAFLKPDTSATVLEMIRVELTKLGYELWQPPLGGAGVLMHSNKPDLFATKTGSFMSKKSVS